ncbi:hypothetical protein AMS68_007644 [Peltaster fructicola]|uniref:FAD-binding domain-containing protein n=1 Tax=Peltaster fructicola TaxID=286661 RepID=A0A6H0Y508_9PEZI|nr:hypothetical protein AMS68_007644 [Peltaster fructicola]
MQFHLNGFKGSDDPLRLQFNGEIEPDFQSSLPDDVDVLIIGGGPAGLLLAAQLAQFPDITTRLIESKPGPLQQGQADGLQCRTIEIFEAFGFSERVLKEAYWVNETTFWSPTDDGTNLIRTGRIRDTEEGLSEFPHVILNQARLHGMWLDAIKWSPARLEPSYSRKLLDLQIPQTGPVEATIERVEDEHAVQREYIKAKYVVGCDGSRSLVRNKLDLEMKGDFANQAWGVMDALVVTDFPDVRLKTVIHSASEGSILIIPREGGYLVRFYIELEKLKHDERVASKNVTSEILIDRARRIFQPFKFEVKQLAYWSVYEVGQRLTNHFDDVPAQERELRTPRVFIAGDACHTHSAKAGQGMNVSMNDTYNLGWKLAAVLRGQAHPKLLHTYSEERQHIAQKLIDFDRKMAKLFAAKPRAGADPDDESSVDPAVFQDYFQQQGRFMSGLATVYAPSMLTSADTSKQHLASGYKIGERFQSSQVVRLSDAKPVQLGHEMKADGRWRIVLFGGQDPPLGKNTTFSSVCEGLYNGLQLTFTPPEADIDSIFDVRAVFQQPRHALDVAELPRLLLPCKGRFGLRDYEKAFTDEPSYGFGFGDIYNVRGIDRRYGCIIAVRPDQYVSGVYQLSDDGVEELSKLFGGFMLRPQRII